MLSRRELLKTTAIATAGMAAPWAWHLRRARAAALPASVPLSDPVYQFGLVGFVNPVPNALDPEFLFRDNNDGFEASRTGSFPNFKIKASNITQTTGLIDDRGRELTTKLWGYGDNTPSWPGQTFQVQQNVGEYSVQWDNKIRDKEHLLPVDTSTHWCYSLTAYGNGLTTQQPNELTIKRNGVPIITHLHGGHSDFQFDGNPEFFFNPNKTVIGPSWDNPQVPCADFSFGTFTTTFRYDANVPAGNLWYHDHALGITRLNVYAGLAGFYFVRDEFDTGMPYDGDGDGNGNNLLPAFPYELAYAIQDRMFTEDGQLFYPAFPGDPFYEGFIVEEGADLSTGDFPFSTTFPDYDPQNPNTLYYGPTALAEFFGDHIVVNGKIWPKTDVEQRKYRMRLLNGCDSRFLVIEFFEVLPDATDFSAVESGPLNFVVIGSDQGLASSATTVSRLVIEPGGRYDVIVNFAALTFGNRVIMRNIGGDEPFGGEPGPQLFDNTDRIMAFDVVLPLNMDVGDPTDEDINQVLADNGYAGNPNSATRTRKVALFEGKDQYGRLQPLLGTAEPATDYQDPPQPINWPNTLVYSSVGLTGQMEGSIAWHSPTTENPADGSTEVWEIWNVTGDAHPIHLHLVNFQVLDRYEITWDSATNEDDRVLDPTGVTAPVPNGGGTYLVTQPVVQHDSVAGEPDTYGEGFRIVNPTRGNDDVTPAQGYVENAPKDMVTALPDQVTRIKVTFDKPGRYVWHCHILSHEDHEMMRVLHVGLIDDSTNGCT